MAKKKKLKRNIREKINIEKKEESPLRNKKRINFFLLAFLAIALVSTLVYSNTFNSSFQYDDGFITASKTVREPGNFLKGSTWFSKDLINRPISMLTFAVNYSIGGYNVTGYHIFNLLIHIVTGFFVFLLINKIFSIMLSGNEEEQNYRRKLSLMAALVFVTHPIQTQSVTYIVQRMTSLSGMFYILAVFLYLKGRLIHVQEELNTKSVILYSAAFLSGICALLSKQSAVTFPAAMLLAEFFFIRDKDGKIYKNYLIYSAVFIVVAFFIVALSGHLPRETDIMTRGEYLITEFKVLVKYLQLLILPMNQTVDYNLTIARTFWDFNILGSLLLLIIVLACGVLLYKRKKILSFCIFWFFITLSVESSIIPIRDIIFEHRLYLPMAGYSLFLAGFLYDIFNYKKRFYINFIFILLILAYGIAAFSRNNVWKTPYSLWADTVEKTPNSSRTNYNFGKFCMMNGDYDKAVRYLNKALKIKPDFPEALNNLGITYYHKGEPEKAVSYYNMALKLKPDYTNVYINLGVVYHLKKDFKKSIEYYNQALSMEPENADALNKLGLAYFDTGRLGEAEIYYKRSLKIDPQNINALNNLGAVMLKKGEAGEAVKYFTLVLKISPQEKEAKNNLEKALRLSGKSGVSPASMDIETLNEYIKNNPDDPDSLNRLGIAWYNKGKYEKAVSFYSKALTLRPKNPVYMNNMGTAYAGMGKMDRALEYFKSSVKENPEYIDALVNLGLVYFKKGDRENALEYAGRAMKIDPSHKNAKNLMKALTPKKTLKK